MNNDDNGPGSYHPTGEFWESKKRHIRQLRDRRSELRSALHVQQTSAEPSRTKIAEIEEHLRAAEDELIALGENLD